MSGMMNMMNSLRQALTPKVTPSEKKKVGLSPMKKAELHTTLLIIVRLENTLTSVAVQTGL